MLEFRSKCRLPVVAFLAACCLLTTGCSITDIFKSVKTDYSISGHNEDAETAEYLQKILNERVSEKTKALSDDEEPELRARYESYIEETLRAELLKALHAKGYYNAHVAFAKGAEPLSGIYDIDYGDKFTISYLDVVPDIYKSDLKEDSAKGGDPLDAENILATQTDLYNEIQKDRCYFNLGVKNRVYLNRAKHTGDVYLDVDAGREGNFGKVTFQGNGSVNESYLRKLIPWREGKCFRREKLEDYKTTLLQSGLFSRAEFILPDEPNEDGSVPVTLDLRERAQRTISAGLSYYSDEGLGGTASWEHRNLFGSAEKLKASLNLSLLKQSLDFDFAKPHFLRRGQTLSLNNSIRRQDTDAYEEYAMDVGGSVDRRFGRHLRGSAGVNASILRIDDKALKTTDTFGLVSTPVSLSYDTRDNTLDPRKGWNLSAGAEPFFDVLGESDPFFKTVFSGSGYYALGTPLDLVLAGRAGIGSVWGADVGDIPATKRFYAGGGGSIRGFGYQEVGPKNDAGDPAGGLSLVTMSLELRTKFTDTIGGVVFVDAGSVNEESTPDFNNMAIGAGVGLRYYTSFGPIRFDIATPLTQKDDLDQNYQFYISIGQAF